MAIRISIITICYNNLQELITTCSSVDNQLVKPFEHWIIDGSDNGEIKSYLENTEHPPYRKWLCERDKGISDAFNKGILRSTGDIVNMLNSGDFYYDAHTLELVDRTFTLSIDAAWLHGKYELKRGGMWVIIGKAFSRKKLYRGMRSVSHQTMFIKRRLHDQYGLYDTHLKIAMDYDFLCRIGNEPFVFIEQPLIRFVPDGISETEYLNSLKELKSVYERYYGFSLKLQVWQIRLKLLHYLIKSPVGKWLYKIKVMLKLENI